MLLDMIRENLTHRGDDYRDLADSVMLAKRWLENNSSSVKDLYSTIKGGYHTHKVKEIGARQVAEFLAKQGKALSHATVSKVIFFSNTSNAAYLCKKTLLSIKAHKLSI